MYLCLTLGVALLLLGILEGRDLKAWQPIVVFGNVAFFYYVLHIPLIHALALIVSVIRSGNVDPWLFTNHPMANPPAPEGYTWSLGLLYLVWAVAVVLLYFPSRWYAGLKRRHRDVIWLSYL